MAVSILQELVERFWIIELFVRDQKLRLFDPELQAQLFYNLAVFFQHLRLLPIFLSPIDLCVFKQAMTLGTILWEAHQSGLSKCQGLGPSGVALVEVGKGDQLLGFGKREMWGSIRD